MIHLQNGDVCFFFAEHGQKSQILKRNGKNDGLLAQACYDCGIWENMLIKHQALTMPSSEAASITKPPKPWRKVTLGLQ